MDYKTFSIEDYLKEAGAKKPVPGGGSVSALVGALASTMGEMAGNFTLGKDEFEDVERQIQTCLKRLRLSRNKLINLTNADAKAYRNVDEAYKLPRETEQEREKRSAEIQKALKDALRVPLNIMRQCAAVAKMAAELAEIANPNLLTDVGVCAVLAEGACAAAEFNVKVNLKYLQAPDIVEKTQPKAGEYMNITRQCREEVVSRVNKHLD